MRPWAEATQDPKAALGGQLNQGGRRVDRTDDGIPKEASSRVRGDRFTDIVELHCWSLGQLDAWEEREEHSMTNQCSMWKSWRASKTWSRKGGKLLSTASKPQCQWLNKRILSVSKCLINAIHKSGCYYHHHSYPYNWASGQINKTNWILFCVKHDPHQL